MVEEEFRGWCGWWMEMLQKGQLWEGAGVEEDIFVSVGVEREETEVAWVVDRIWAWREDTRGRRRTECQVGRRCLRSLNRPNHESMLA